MLKFRCSLDIAQARRSFAGMGREVNKAAATALRRTATTVRKEADQEIRKRLNLKSGTVKQALVIQMVPGRLIVEIVASGKPVPLKDYGARQTRKGATFQVAKGKGRRVYQRQGRTGFIVPRFGSHVYVRVTPDPPGAARAKIEKVYGPSIPQYFVTRFIRERMLRVARERWPIEFAREISYRQRRAAGSA